MTAHRYARDGAERRTVAGLFPDRDRAAQVLVTVEAVARVRWRHFISQREPVVPRIRL